jgi:hypothetical protein
MSSDSSIPYTPLEVTKRKQLLKLELSGAVPKQLEAVAKTVYGIGLQSTGPTENNREWHTTDNVLYSDAKKSYDEILQVFQSEPRVYKLASVKEKIWERNRQGGHLECPHSPTAVRNTLQSKNSTQKEGRTDFFKKKKRIQQVAQDKKEISVDELARTFIDPFEPVMPKDGPQKESIPIWFEKLEMLKSLTPREDLEGYEYKEDYFSQQERLHAQTLFQSKMRTEIQRREDNPTEIEQVIATVFLKRKYSYLLSFLPSFHLTARQKSMFLCFRWRTYCLIS